jgi:hypothetical protein
MRVLGLFGLTLLLSVEPGIAAQSAPTDARRSEATAVADTSIKKSGAGQLAPDSRGATVVAALAGTMTMTMAPVPVVEPGEEMFIGTGDFSNGFWVRP